VDERLKSPAQGSQTVSLATSNVLATTCAETRPRRAVGKLQFLQGLIGGVAELAEGGGLENR
jgi:hypothetical protein